MLGPPRGQIIGKSLTETGPVYGGKVKEINKVKRRLRLWAKRPYQINSRILTTYLKLERQGVNPITEKALNNAIGGEPSISSNLLQMRISAEKNHGKVFDQNGEKLTLWPQ